MIKNIKRINKTFWSLVQPLLLIFCLFSELAEASENPYYRAEVPVVSQNPEERKLAAVVGLEQVLYRLTGIERGRESLSLQEALRNPEAYLEQFHYADLDQTLAKDSLPEGAQAMLVMDFSAQLIDKLLTGGGVPFWPLNRPQVLIWLVEDSLDFGRVLVNDPASAAFQSLSRAAQSRGLPIRLPLLDLEDQLALPADRAWLMDEESILAASQRYDADTVLIGRFSQTSLGEWLAAWQYFHRDDSGAFDERSKDGLTLGVEAINGLADYLIARYAVRRSVDSVPMVAFELEGVDNFKDYSRVIQYLDELAVISSYDLVEIRESVLVIQAKVVGGVEQFNNALSLDGKLSPLDRSQLDEVPMWLRDTYGTSEQPLQYVWQK